MVLRIGAVFALIFGLVACTSSSNTSVGCTVEQAVSGVVALTIAQELQCSNQAAIQASIATAASKAGICASVPATSIGKPKVASGIPLKSTGSDICSAVANDLLGSVVNGVVPSAWGCSNATVTTQLSGLVTAACVKAFP